MSHDIDNLLRQIEADDSQVRISAADALGEMGELAIEPLCHALGHRKWFVRASAAYALGGIGSNKAINALCRALGDSDTSDPVGSCNVRLSAVYALTRIGKPAVTPLCEVFAHGEKEARWMSSSALGKIGDISTVQPLCQALGDSDGDIRACAVCALGEIGAPAVEALCLMLCHRDWTVRACAANALARIGDAKAMEPLREALRRIDSPVRKLVSWAFAERIDFKWGVRQTARVSEADALRRALDEIGKHPPNKNASPNGGPAAAPGNSGVSEGQPSVS